MKLEDYLNHDEVELIRNKLNYAPEVFDKIQKVDHCYFFGRRFSVDPKRYSTEDGIIEQLESFIMPIGLVYYVDENLEMLKIPLTIKASVFYRAHIRSSITREMIEGSE